MAKIEFRTGEENVDGMKDRARLERRFVVPRNFVFGGAN